jgi:hypothetical protein
MLFKILDKYSQLKKEHEIQQEKDNKIIEEHDKEIIKTFLDLYDKDVKIIHANQEKIEKNIQALNAESVKFNAICKDALNVYDNLVEYFKEAGDLFNFCNIVKQEIEDIENKVFEKKGVPVIEEKLDT